MRLELYDALSPEVAPIWRALEGSTSSYFLRWPWVENWLACLPRAALPKLAVVVRDGSPVSAAFVGQRALLRRASRAWFLNTTGIDRFDNLVIEHNAAVGGELGDLIEALPGSCDELVVPLADAVPRVPPAFHVRVDREVASYYVDLALVRAHGYEALIGRSTRTQLRRAQRRAGTLALDIPNDVAGALACYDELVAHHQRRWRARGQPGAFADPWFDRFHRRLITRRFAHGEIQLARVHAGGATLGCLYNFVCAGRVLFYQSGIPAPAHAHDKPGYLCHARLIEHSAREGHAIYDLLGGDARYKGSLATAATRLVTFRVQRRRPQFAIEAALSRALRSWRDRSSS
ncbi:MAG: GNAT family N-acetyltransferase [Deltaproteobacteria bacterium]|nr:GNAT family N-acetyltransferase [Deltaproteobacteria bacterium]